jgi:hypothetical protein
LIHTQQDAFTYYKENKQLNNKERLNGCGEGRRREKKRINT